jgi:outer membrane protein
MRSLTSRLSLVLVLAFLGLASAQNGCASAPFRLAFVDTQALIAAHPAQSEIARLGEALDAELQELLGQRQGLLQKQATQGLTAEEEELLQALNVTIETRRDAGLTDIRNAAAPAEEAANAIIREIAQNDGFALVLDIDQAAGLVVFASAAVPDITEAAVALMQERYPAE